MSTSHSTDKLKIICEAAKDIIKNNPDIGEKIKSISIVWTDYDDVIVPDVKIEFYE